MKTFLSLTVEQKNIFSRDGFLVIEDFITQKECDLLIQRAKELITDFEPEEIKTIFSTKNSDHEKNLYFLESGDKIRFFFEEDSFSKQGELIKEKSLCINKIGHALHDLDPIFNAFSRKENIASLVNDLGVTHPLLIQSMYICKQPFIGGEVLPHQDSTYLFVKERPVLGLWFALQDATLQNGCLWAIPEGHQTPLKSRFIRENGNQIKTIVYDSTPWPLEKMIPLEVPRGSLIALHGLLPHMSKANHSPHGRDAYTLHVMSGQYEYASNNWLQRPKDSPFQGFMS